MTRNEVTLNEVIARNVKALREEREMHQTDLAAAAGLTASFVSQIEAGVRACRTDTIAALARALKVKPHVLLMKKREEVTTP